jgi:hypothetical protein
MKTSGGSQAAGIAKWAWDDPASRVRDAISQVRELARFAASQAELAEIQDTGQMLARLEDSLEPQDEGLISSQLGLAGETITGQILDLARTPAWVHEKRGPHGKWVGSGGLPYTGPMNRARAERIRQMQRQGQMRSPAAVASPAVTGTGNKAANVLARVQGSPEDSSVHEQIKAEILDKTKAHVSQVMQQHTENVEQGERQRALLKAATEGSIAIAGGIIAAIEAKLGVPDLVAIASATAPLLIQILIEWWKRL